MGNKKIVDKTTNRGEFNRAYKRHLESKGKIRCTYCRYHRNENGKGSGYYGGYDDDNIKYPNWKLVSKNNKQWMQKPIKIITSKSRWNNNTYIDIKW